MTDSTAPRPRAVAQTSTMAGVSPISPERRIADWRTPFPGAMSSGPLMPSSLRLAHQGLLVELAEAGALVGVGHKQEAPPLAVAAAGGLSGGIEDVAQVALLDGVGAGSGGWRAWSTWRRQGSW